MKNNVTAETVELVFFFSIQRQWINWMYKHTYLHVIYNNEFHVDCDLNVKGKSRKSYIFRLYFSKMLQFLPTYMYSCSQRRLNPIGYYYLK